MMPSPEGDQIFSLLFHLQRNGESNVALRLLKYLIRQILESFWKENVKKQEVK